MFMRKGRSLNRLIGDFLIVFSLLLIVWIYYPIFEAYFLPNKAKLEDTSYYISIPKINALSPVVDNIDPWNKFEYQKALEKGVAKATGFKNFLFAHSSLPPWKMTRTNTAFLRLGELKKGDQIIIHKDGKDIIYKVIEKIEIWPNQLDLISRSDDKLILQTCTPIGTDFKRLLVFAKHVDN